MTCHWWHVLVSQHCMRHFRNDVSPSQFIHVTARINVSRSFTFRLHFRQMNPIKRKEIFWIFLDLQWFPMYMNDIWTEVLFAMYYTWAPMRTHALGGGDVDWKNYHCQNFLQCFGPNQRSPGWVGPTNHIWNPHVVYRFNLELREIYHRPRMENSHCKCHEPCFGGMVNMVIVLMMPQKWIYLHYC